MAVSLNSIVELLKSKSVEFYVVGHERAVEIIAAIDLNVNKSLCYYVGDNPSQLDGIRDSIVICKPVLQTGLEPHNTYIFTEHPQLAFYYSSELFIEKLIPEIHHQVVIDENAKIGVDVSIGAFCVIEECVIGDYVVIESGVKIHKGTIIGNNVHIQSGSVIGAEGVMWAWDENGRKVPCAQTGSVIIEDNVSIGSNISIARGAFMNKPTVIRNGTMIAHGTMIGHGVVVGAHNHFANNVSLAGSVITGDRCFLGAGAVVRPHVNIVANTIIGAGAVVVKDITDEKKVWVGNPARSISDAKKSLSGVPVDYI